MRGTPLERFAEKVRTEVASGCHIWIGERFGRMGYGRFNMSSKTMDGKRQRVRVMAHRAAWEFYRGPIPHGLFVLHRCDNPPCVNPDHLFLGTKADNNADMVKKGRNRGPQGESHPAAKLTWDKVCEIRRRRAAGELLSALSDEFGVDQATISAIARGRIWKESASV